MKAVLNKALRGDTTAVLSHKNESIRWNLKLIEKTSKDDEVDIFEQINAYWAQLPEQTQDRLFDLYQTIRYVIDQSKDQGGLTKALIPLVAELSQFHRLEDIEHWVRFHSSIGWPGPDQVKLEYNERDSPGTRDRTYILDDYKQLVYLSIALRPVLLVWGDFVFKIESEAGTQWKEYRAYHLLAQSELFNSVPMEKLRVFVDATLPKDKTNSAAIMEGISEDDFPTYIAALCVVRRVSIGDIRGLPNKPNLVTFVWKYIGQKSRPNENSALGNIKDKLPEGSGGDSESNLSKLEGYKARQDIPAGDIAIIESYLYQPIEVAKKIAPDIDALLVDEALSQIRSLRAHRVWAPQLSLIQIVLKPAMSPRGMSFLSYDMMMHALAVTQALLWHRGYYDLAALVSAESIQATEEVDVDSLEGRSRTPKELLERLDQLFPYSRKTTGKKSEKRKNPGMVAVESLEGKFRQYEWRTTLPATWLEKISRNPHDRRYRVPGDIKITLMRLAIAVAERSF